MGADFSGYATKAGLKCSDGRTIMPDAFKANNGQKVPLVWQHGHNEPGNVLGHAILENREDGVYAYAFFNGSDKAKDAKISVEHGDITSLSIYANKLVERSKQVFHGVIREVSLVMSGANPGALIDNVSIRHSDGDVETLDEEAIIFTGLSLEHSTEGDEDEDENEDDEEADDIEHGEATAKDIFEALSDQEKEVVYYMIGAALQQEAGTAAHSDLEGTSNVANVFENNEGTNGDEGHALSHEDVKGIVGDAMRSGSLKEAVSDYAIKHGIENIDIMFPDAKAVTDRPEFVQRRIEWVASVLGGTRHTPFSRIKSLTADLTHDAARAKGYIKGNFKKEEFFAVSKRVTTPTTIYKKQKLDRDDIVDITDFDIVAWLKAEMRMMLDEELARAILVGDGRELDDEDKIRDPAGASDGAGIRSIANDHELYVTTVNVNLSDTTESVSALVDSVLSARQFYKGTGQPTFYTTEPVITRMLLLRDKMGRRLYTTLADLASEMRVASVVPVEVMENQGDLVGIIVNLSDYTIGTDQGGALAMFDDFDIDYNQYKYLMETRLSGALTKVKSAMVVRTVDVTDAPVAPVAPTFSATTNTVTVPVTSGVTYTVDGKPVTGAVVLTKDTTVQAVANEGFYFTTNANDEWTYKFTPKA